MNIFVENRQRQTRYVPIVNTTKSPAACQRSLPSPKLNNERRFGINEVKRAAETLVGQDPVSANHISAQRAPPSRARRRATLGAGAAARKRAFRAAG